MWDLYQYATNKGGYKLISGLAINTQDEKVDMVTFGSNKAKDCTTCRYCTLFTSDNCPHPEYNSCFDSCSLFHTGETGDFLESVVKEYKKGEE